MRGVLERFGRARGWFLMGGTRGARTDDDATPLDGRRQALAWASFALLALILAPLPHVLAPGIGIHCPYV